MGTVSKTFTENGNGSSYASTWTVTYSASDIVANGPTFTVTYPSATAKYIYGSKNYAMVTMEAMFDLASTVAEREDPYYWFEGSLASNTPRSIPITDGNNTITIGTNELFNEANSTSKTLGLSLYAKTGLSSWKGSSKEFEQYNYYNGSSGVGVVYPNSVMVTLDVPPTATIRPLSVSGPQYYAGLTTISVDIEDIVVYYGGNLTDGVGSVKFEIGGQSVEAHPAKTGTVDTYHSSFADTTLSITLQNAGTFTPKITVTDSRGQTCSEEFSPIVVQSYNPTTSIQSVSRVNSSTGKADDEGTNAVVACTFDYPTISNNYMKAPVVKIEGQTPTNNVTWYTSWTAIGGFIDQVSFSNYNPTRPVTLYGKITDALAKTTSYDISVACDTTLGAGSAYYKTLPQSFYLLCGGAGGHSLGVGMKPPIDPVTDKPVDGLHVGMEEVYHKKADQEETDKVWSADNGQEDVAALYWDGTFLTSGMAGMIQMFAGSTAPTGWLTCDGSAVSRTDYATLFDVIGTTYGAGDGSTTFNLPDFSGRMPIGVGESTADGHTAHTLAEADGKEAYKLTGAQSGVQDHNHVYYDYDTTYSFSTGYRTTTDHSHYAYTGNTASRANHQRTTNGSGAKDATVNHTNMPPYLGINFIIATGETA